MAQEGEADVALLQEVGKQPGGLTGLTKYDGQSAEEWNSSKNWKLYNRWPAIFQLSDRVKVERFQAVPSICQSEIRNIRVSDIGTIAVARVIPYDDPDSSFMAVSMYARWPTTHASMRKSEIWAADEMTHCILSDISPFTNDWKTTRHRILAAADLNMIYNKDTQPFYSGKRGEYWLKLERTVWQRFNALGLEFLGPQYPNGRLAPSTPERPDTQSVPTYKTSHEKSPADSCRQLDYAFASRGFHEQVSVHALNELNEWGPSDHCRLLIEVKNSKTTKIKYR